MSPFPDQTQTLLLKACTSLSANQAIDFFEQWKNLIDIDLEGANSKELGLPQVYDRLDFGSQRLLSLLYFNLKSHGHEDYTIGKLKGYFKYVWLKNQIINQDLNQILEKFDTKGIQAIAFKGTSIARYYPHLGTRPTVDLDLVVKQEDLENIAPTLIQLGWKTVVFPAQIEQMKDLLTHAITLKKGNSELDLHVRFSQFLFKKETLYHFWESSKKTETGVRYLSSPHELFCIILHGMVYSPIPTIRWVADSVFIIRTFTKNDWQELLSLTQKEKYGLLIKRALNFLIDEQFIQLPNYLDSSFLALIPTDHPSPYIKIHQRKKQADDFNIFRRHYLTATAFSDSYIGRWRLLAKHYKIVWNLHSNVGLITHAINVIFRKLGLKK
ncbi:nucleotidyltransferase family protein [Ekhidna sp. To15]|uniref:nucleotidyltransferase family protein n=1 Tax=Ekhidna sp. To15 TaxID=3395267 RepID=UPI003F52513E